MSYYKKKFYITFNLQEKIEIRNFFKICFNYLTTKLFICQNEYLTQLSTRSEYSILI